MPALFATVCPACGKAITLKGSRLRVWLYEKKKNPNRKGPYCSYRCSCVSNLRSKLSSDSPELTSTK